MGEQKRKQIFFNKRSEGEAENIDNSHSYIQIKRTPDCLVQLQRMLQQPEYKYYADRAQKGTDFGDCIGIIAADLGIACDGLYDYHAVLRLVELIIEALPKAEKLGAGFNPATLGGGLTAVELVETKEDIQLLEVGQALGEKVTKDEGRAPYTICRGCITSYDCCSERTCKLGKPADQLGDTMKKINLLRESMQ
jgi:hypothetical protein